MRIKLTESLPKFTVSEGPYGALGQYSYVADGKECELIANNYDSKDTRFNLVLRRKKDKWNILFIDVSYVPSGNTYSIRIVNYDTRETFTNTYPYGIGVDEVTRDLNTLISRSLGKCNLDNSKQTTEFLNKKLDRIVSRLFDYIKHGRL